MKAILLVLLAGLVACPTASAVPVSLFSDIDTFLKRAEQIVVAKCVSVPEGAPNGFIDGFYPAEVSVLKSLKGDLPPGALTVATIYEMIPGERYLLASSGGGAFDTKFLALGELTVVPVPENFDLKLLEGKTTKQQVQMLFARHLYEIERKLAPLLEQKEQLDRAVAGRGDNLYKSAKPVKVGDVKELATTNKNSAVSLTLGGMPLNWSVQAPGESGYFYFSDPQPGAPDWEFATSDRTELEEFDGQPLSAKFFGLYSPSRDPALGQAWGNAITVKLGQILLARTVAQPGTIYVIKLHEQGPESLKVQYFVWEE